MLQFIELDAVLNYVSSGIREEYNIPQLMSWAYHGLSHINTIERYERIKCLLEVCSHKVQLPDELVSINGVRYVPDNPMQSENCCNECIEEVKEEKECCCIFINHRLFIESQWHIKDFTPMRYMGNARSKWCKTCPDAHNISCSLTYTVDIDKMLTASTQEGWICLDYMIVPKREGKTIIPDDVSTLSRRLYNGDRIVLTLTNLEALENTTPFRKP